jgi:A/G-specific adenine glycosylase
LWEIAEAQLPHARLADHTQAQMDFGATLCTRADPACVLCPLQHECVALREDRVRELPTPKPGKPLPERHALVLLLRDAGGRVLLQRRGHVGVWAGLWSLPEAEDHAAARGWFDANIAGDYDAASALAPIDHGFTHYRLAMQPLEWREVALRDGVRDNTGLRWIARAELPSLGIPAPVRKLLEGRT